MPHNSKKSYFAELPQKKYFDVLVVLLVGRKGCSGEYTMVYAIYLLNNVIKPRSNSVSLWSITSRQSLCPMTFYDNITSVN